MSRLANLLMQAAATTQTQEKLGATYFENTSPKHMAPRPWRRGLLLCGVAVLGMLAGLLIAAVGFPSGWKHASPLTSVYPLLTFDDADTWELLGRQFGLWWGAPGRAGQSLTLALDPDMYAGSSGRSLRIDYALPPSAEAPAPLGVWFLLPAATRNRPYQLEFQIRGDDRAGDTRRATLELRNQSVAEQHPLTIGPEWTTVRIPLNGRVEECRILLGGQPMISTHGRIYLDQIRLTGLTP